MTVEVQRDALLSAVRGVAAAIERRSTIPILSNILFEAADGTIRLTGTDLDLQARASCDGDGELATTLPAERLQAAVTSLRPGAMTLELEHSIVTIRQGRSTRTLPTLPVTDFPQFPSGDHAARFAIDPRTLARLIDTTSVAQSDEVARPYLNGIFLHATDGKFVAAATNGHIMCRCTTTLPEGSETLPDVIVPTKAIALIRKLLADSDEQVMIDAGRGQIVVASGQMSITAKLIDGTFPDYQRIIPATSELRLSGVRSAISESAAAAVAMADGKTRVLRLDLKPGDEPQFSTRASDGAAAVEPIAAEHDGAALTIGINARFVIGVAGNFGEASPLVFHFGGPDVAVLVVSEAEPDLTGVIMPMRV